MKSKIKNAWQLKNYVVQKHKCIDKIEKWIQKVFFFYVILYIFVWLEHFWGPSLIHVYHVIANKEPCFNDSSWVYSSI